MSEARTTPDGDGDFLIAGSTSRTLGALLKSGRAFYRAATPETVIGCAMLVGHTLRAGVGIATGNWSQLGSAALGGVSGLFAASFGRGEPIDPNRWDARETNWLQRGWMLAKRYPIETGAAIGLCSSVLALIAGSGLASEDPPISELIIGVCGMAAKSVELFMPERKHQQGKATAPTAEPPIDVADSTDRVVGAKADGAGLVEGLTATLSRWGPRQISSALGAVSDAGFYVAAGLSMAAVGVNAINAATLATGIAFTVSTVTRFRTRRPAFDEHAPPKQGELEGIVMETEAQERARLRREARTDRVRRWSGMG